MILYNKHIAHTVFCYPKKYWYRNLAAIPHYFRRLHFLITHGYDEDASGEAYDWFIRNMKEILTSYRQNHDGCLILDDTKNEDENASAWNAIIDRMITLLSAMDEFDPQYDTVWEAEDLGAAIKDFRKQLDDAKEEFFVLFSRYFYFLWD